jgi:hypothetical protein
MLQKASANNENKNNVQINDALEKLIFIPFSAVQRQNKKMLN